MTTQTFLDDQQTIDASYLGKLIGRSTKSIRVDVTRRPDTLPPRFIIPGTRKVLWRVKDVRDWMDGIAELEIERRIAIRRAGGTVVKPFHLGDKKIALAAGARKAAQS